ncbi:hypothetical protein OIU84_024838 [Salix udensis]|uniref:Uncharacterized protein n=1 Tax=Salix udensis TaxID=889485 RepID=A0AAD6PCY7_9ROSI|nr:hypothetical protein OIU84_024838 [Salix udensis]
MMIVRNSDISQLELQPIKDIQNQSPNEVLEEDCGTPGHTVPEEKSEEQNQAQAMALLSKEKDYGTEMIIENIEEYVHVELPADPHNYSPPKITEDTSELEVSRLGAELNTGIQKDSLNEVQVEERNGCRDITKRRPPHRIL